jgi:hypothetical protein
MQKEVVKTRKMKDNPFRKNTLLKRKEVLHMNHDTPWAHDLPSVPDAKACLSPMIVEAVQPPALRGWRKRGRPMQVAVAHLALAVLWCLLQGWQVQREVWRLICTQQLGAFAPVQVSDQAIYKRLDEQGGSTLQALFEQMRGWLRDWLSPYQDWTLAPFASEVYAIDESKLDQVGRWLKGLREKPVGDLSLLAGRISAVFDVRRQLWVRLDVLKEASADCKVHARALLDGLERGALLLFDRGYYSFSWFDDLTRAGFWWIARLRSKGSYTIQHVFVEADQYFEALVQLGAYRSDRAAYTVRLVRFRYRGEWYSYLTNVLDPRLLSGSQIAYVYARRWDIEMAFRLLKDYLGLNLLWSAKWQVIAAQIWACAILAQMFHALQVKLATCAEVEVFDVSLELLIRQTSRHMLTGQWRLDDLLRDLVGQGRHIGLIRPSSRLSIEVPEVPWHGFLWPPSDLVYERPPRYGHRPAGNRHRQQKQPVAALT